VKKYLIAGVLMLGWLLLPFAGDAGSIASLSLALATVLWLLGSILEPEHVWAGKLKRVLGFATWPMQVTIEGMELAHRLWARPKRWEDVVRLSDLWEVHPGRVTAQLERCDLALLHHCTSASAAAGFSLAVVDRIVAAEWAAEHERAAWSALGTCHDPMLLDEGIKKVQAWSQDDSTAPGRYAAISLHANTAVSLAHVAQLVGSVRGAVWGGLDAIERSQGRNLFHEAYPGVYHTDTLIRLADMLTGPSGTVVPMSNEMLLGDLLDVLDANGAARYGYVPVLAAVLAEEVTPAGRGNGSHAEQVARAFARVEALDDLEGVAKLLAAGAVGSIDELAEVATLVS
jgi:hypothetical protein